MKALQISAPGEVKVIDLPMPSVGNQEVLLKMKEVLKDAEAPAPKAPEADFKALFEKALPDYDRDRFYVSHMKKVAEWYNILSKYASLDFLTDEEREAEAAKNEEA